MKRLAAALFLYRLMFAANGAKAAEAYGIGLEGFAYPYPVSMLSVPTEAKRCAWPIWM
jgi:hypothetical protein